MHDECIPPDLVDRLHALGHADVVRAQALAEDGDWFCARAWARLLAGRGELEEALRVLAPYVGTSWWTAAAEAARLLDAEGRGEEAYALLLPHVADWCLAEALAEVGVRVGRGEEVTALLAARTVPGCPCARCGSPECGGRYPEPFNAVNLLASVREGQGRTDEAVEVLRTYGSTPVNNRDPLAELLVRHGRIDELRAYAAGEDRLEAARRLAEVLEARGGCGGCGRGVPAACGARRLRTAGGSRAGAGHDAGRRT
ncbi:hypothetical protein [Streptomyces sp. NPDC048496]|uniref:hypothetical protein n=1 Tax=Streptomyces sp. NPDC048496 TaxID=3365558 RepID=UPI003724068C